MILPFFLSLESFHPSVISFVFICPFPFLILPLEPSSSWECNSSSTGFLIDSRLNGDVLRGVVYSVILALGSFFCFTFSSIVFFLPLWIPHIFFISINGAANAGSDAMLGSAVPARLGAAYGGSTAAITGLVNGFGTVGSFLQGPMSGFIGGHWGWMMNLYLMLGLNLLAAFTAVRAYKARRGS